MTMTQTLTLHLPEEIAALIKAAVARGEYATPDDMVEDALRGWTELRSGYDPDALRQVCQDAIADTRPGVEPGPVFARLEKRFQALIHAADAQEDEVQLAPRVESDLKDIGLYIARHNQRRTVSFVRELEDHFETIANHPEGYRLREDLGKGIRISPYERYLVVFRILGEIVRIDRVMSGYRDLGHLV